MHKSWDGRYTDSKRNLTKRGDKVPMKHNFFSESYTIHDECFTFSSKYFWELQKELDDLIPKTSPRRNGHLKLVVDNTKKKGYNKKC